MTIRICSSFLLLLICVANTMTAQETPDYKNPALTVEQRVADLLERMTL